MTNKALSKELRCLRMHLSGFMSSDKLSLIEEAERRLSPGAVSTNPARSSSKGQRKRGPRKSPQKVAFDKFFNK